MRTRTKWWEALCGVSITLEGTKDHTKVTCKNCRALMRVACAV